MKLIAEVAPEKIRGGFYTPPELVDACLARVQALLPSGPSTRFLEPSAGDGAFIRGVHRLCEKHRALNPRITCVEVMESEAAACEQELARLKLNGRVVRDSFFSWANEGHQPFDAFIGNPPFIRYQFVPPEDRSLAEFLMRIKGYELQGVSNYWIPFVIVGLEFLRVGGVFGLVLPAEIFSTVSGGQVRSYLVRHFESLRVDLYPRDTFPDILQDVLVVSGIRAENPRANREVVFSETIRGKTREWTHSVPDTGESWKRYLLSHSEWEAYEAGKDLPGFARLKDLATIGVAIVTGANDFFTVDDGTLRQYGLEQWARPLLARTSDSPGIVFQNSDHDAARRLGNKAWLLDFSDDKLDPMTFELARKYLEIGEALELHTRYKCRIRTPWYRVPGIVFGKLMITKRSHQHHRLILNKAEAFTTDTVYRGQTKPPYARREADLVAGFHNSLTLLSAELEGRSYGGGVLELVPSEVGRLIAPLVATGEHIERLDEVSRKADGQLDTEGKLIEATDGVLAKAVPEYGRLVERLSVARTKLRDRRFSG